LTGLRQLIMTVFSGVTEDDVAQVLREIQKPVEVATFAPPRSDVAVCRWCVLGFSPVFPIMFVGDAETTCHLPSCV
jgi:hypothetical protein